MTNLYGPTEATVTATTSDPLTGSGTPPIGRAVANARVLLLDEQLRPLPTGVVGSLYIGGQGLARGYVNQPALTAERFIACPFIPGERLYRTGDLAYQQADGQYVFVGRDDDQVKIRGHRIELAEVQNAVCRHPDVTQAVAAVTHVGSERRLVAWVVSPQPQLSGAEVARHASHHVPSYMVPSAVGVLTEFPLTVNGKVDVHALPDPQPSTQRSYEPAATPQEQVICEAFVTVLGVPTVGRHDGFFELGGHSLLAVRLVAALEPVFGAHVTLSLVMANPTPAELARAVAHPLPATDGGSAPSIITLRQGGEGPALYCIHGANGLGVGYAPLAAATPACSVYAVQSPWLGDTVLEHLPVSLAVLARSYAAAIHRHSGGQVVRLLGWSFGGVLAHAVAAELGRLHTVAGLILLDSHLSADLSDLGDDAVQAVAQGGVTAGGLGWRRGLVAEPARPPADDTSQANIVALTRSHMLALSDHQPQPVACDVVLVEATKGRPRGSQVLPEWQSWTHAPVQHVAVECYHEELLEESVVHQWWPSAVTGHHPSPSSHR